MSGAISACSQANSFPVRPNPVAISSAISKIPSRSHILRIRFNHSGWYMRIPPAPWTIGSMITAAIS
ncbi:Uncharacterised protein [Shigella sonnei]|nr:Uncharacterised protein [Shigella sonnei]